MYQELHSFTGSFLLVSFCNLLWRHCVEYYNGFSGEFQKRQSSGGSPEEKYHCISAPVLSWHLSNKKKKWKKWGWCRKDIMRHIKPIPHSGNIISILSTIFSCYTALYLIKILCIKEKSGLEIEYEIIVYRDIKHFIKFPHQRTTGLHWIFSL